MFIRRNKWSTSDETPYQELSRLRVAVTRMQWFWAVGLYAYLFVLAGTNKIAIHGGIFVMAVLSGRLSRNIVDYNRAVDRHMSAPAPESQREE